MPKQMTPGLALPIASVGAALGGFVLVIATRPGAQDVRPPAHAGVSVSALLADPRQDGALEGEVELPRDPPRSTRVIAVAPNALVGARAITISGSTVKLVGVRPGARAPQSIDLRVASGERLVIEYDNGRLGCFVPVDAHVRIEEVPVPREVDQIDYRFGYVRSSWRGNGTVRACVHDSSDVAIAPNKIAAGMHFVVPAKHATLVSVDGSHLIRCPNLEQLRIVTMSPFRPENVLGPILIDQSFIDPLERDRFLGVTCEEPSRRVPYERVVCTLEATSFECIPR